MDNRRLILFAALAFVGFLLYQAWLQDYGPKEAPAAAEQGAPAAVSAATPPAAPGSPAAAAPAVQPAAVPATATLPKGREIHVRTDVLDLVIDTAGGDIRRAELLKYPEELKDQAKPVRVLDDQEATLLVLQSGLQP